MLAEIFVLRLEAMARETTSTGSIKTVSDTRFVPVATIAKPGDLARK